MLTEFRPRTIALLFARLLGLWPATCYAQVAAIDVTSMGFEATVLRDLGIGIEYESTADALLAG